MEAASETSYQLRPRKHVDYSGKPPLSWKALCNQYNNNKYNKRKATVLEVKTTRLAPTKRKKQKVTDDRPSEPVQAVDYVDQVCDDADGHYKDLDEGLVLAQRYMVEHELGRGTFAKVVQCEDLQGSERKVAIKVIKNMDAYRAAAFVEIVNLQNLQKNECGDKVLIVKLEDWFEFRHHICLVFDLLGPSLYDVLKETNFRPFAICNIKSFAHQLLRAVSLMHKQGLTHTDLKPENILLLDHNAKNISVRSRHKGTTKLANTRVQLIDIGSAATMHKPVHTRLVSTRHYRAPEIILDLGWGFECDMWSLGCILIELYTGHALFQTHENLEHLAMMEAVLGPIPPTLIARSSKQHEFFRAGRLHWPEGAMSEDSRAFVDANMRPLKQLRQGVSFDHALFIDLIRGLLCYEKDKRLSAQQALKHDFFADVQ